MDAPAQRTLTRREAIGRAASGLVGAGSAPALLHLVRATARAQSSEPVRIGILASLTGAVQVWGRSTRQGALMAVDEINASGGILGRPVELKLEDDESNVEVGLRKAHKLVLQDRVDVLVGINHSGVLLSVVNALPELKRILICPCATSTQASTQRFNRYFFRVHTNSEMEGAALATYASRLPFKRWSVIAPDYAYGYETWGAFAGKLKELRPDVEIMTVQAWPPFAAGEYSSHLTRLLAARPEAVLGSMWGGDAVALVRQAQLFRFFDRVAFFTPAGLSIDVLYALRSGVPEGLHTSSHSYWFEFPSTPRHKAFVERFVQTWNEYPHPTAHDTYSAVHLFKYGVERAGSLNTEEIIQALEGVRFETPSGTRLIRAVDHQAVYDIPVGRTARRPDLPMEVGVASLEVIPGEKIATPEETVLELRRKQAQPEYMKYVIRT